MLTPKSKNNPKVKKSFFSTGFSLIEMLVYTGIMALFLIVCVNASIVMVGAYGRARAAKLLNTSAVQFLSKMNTEVQKASNIDSASSILQATPGKLVLDQTTQSGTEKVEFSVVDGAIEMRRAGIVLGMITPEGTNVEALVFYKIENAGRQAARMVVTLSALRGGNTKTETFYLTTALRGAY